MCKNVHTHYIYVWRESERHAHTEKEKEREDLYFLVYQHLLHVESVY